jgi:hypothetical protein
MAKNEVLEAVIKDGKLYCGKCGEPLGIRDKYSEIAYEGEKYTQFINLYPTQYQFLYCNIHIYSFLFIPFY